MKESSLIKRKYNITTSYARATSIDWGCIVVIQLLSHVLTFVTSWTAARQAPLSSTITWSLFRFISIELVMLTISSSVTRFSCLQSFPAPGSFQMSLFFTSIRWPNYWSFSFSIRPSNKYSGLISFRMDWLDLPAVQGILNSLIQHQLESINSWGSHFFMIQLSYLYLTTGETIALIIWTLVNKVMSLF